MFPVSVILIERSQRREFICFSGFHRREVYRILQEEGIDLPRYAVLNRDPDKPDGQPVCQEAIVAILSL